MPTTTSSDVLVIGGGVIGLSIAYQLARDGVTVTLLERGQPGREASWAGAGILPPGSWYVDHPALDQLALAAAVDQPAWSQQLREETGIDDEYWQCGAAYVETPANEAILRAVFARWQQLGIAIQQPLQGNATWNLPCEAQLRNPRRLRALVVACENRGVRILSHTAVERVVRQPSGPIDAVATSAGRYSAGAYCFAAGSWTPRLAEQAGSVAPGKPVRGQMLLFEPLVEPLQQIIHRYPYYAVPRRDGRVLVGATVEDRGFDKQSTDNARDELFTAAVEIAPRLATARVEAQWAGLRPASTDELPSIGRLPGIANAWVASGHHRSGLQFAPPTARLLSAMIRGVASDLPAAPFDPQRFAPDCRDGAAR